MAFKASKERKRKEPDPVGRGSPIAPSAAVKLKYQKQMMWVVKAMLEDYKHEMAETLAHPEVEQFYGEDASVSSIFKRILKKLDKKWKEVFSGFATKAAYEFTRDADKNATAATLNSLSTAGIDQPRATFNEYVQNTLEAATDFNHTLIVNIQQEVHEKIYTSVMLSLTSPNPEQQGQAGIEAALREAGITAKDRVELIARDQTSKLYSALADDRMRENGVDEFEWAHSSAGKVPRESHVHMDGHIFKLNDPRLWEVGGEFNLKKGDLGPPGWAINCRCRRIPVIR